MASGANLLLSHHGTTCQRPDAHGGSWPGMADDDGFKQVQRRRRSRGPFIKCTKPGCTGTCPRAVVEQGLRGVGFVPAKCRICDRKYKLVPGDTSRPPSKAPQRPAPAQNDLQRQVRTLQHELNLLKASKPALPPAAKGSVSATTTDAPDDPIQAELKIVREEITALKGLDSKLHGLIQGGYAQALEAAEAKRDSLLAARRGGLPLKERLAKSQAFVETSEKKLETERAKADRLAAQQAELAAKIRQQDEAVSTASAKLALAKSELATISAEVSAENAQSGAGNSEGTSAIAPQEVALLRDLFSLVPQAALQSVCEGNSMDSEDVVQRTQILLSKIEGQASVHCDDSGVLPVAPHADRGSEAPRTSEEEFEWHDDERDMEVETAELAEFEDLFRAREDESPEMRTQRLRAGIKSKRLSPINKFRKS